MVAAAKSAAGEARADQSRKVLRQRYHGVGFNAAGFKVLAVARMSLGHQPSQLSRSCCISASAAATVRVFSVIT